MRILLISFLFLGAAVLCAAAEEPPTPKAGEEPARDVIYIVPIHGEINRAMQAFVHRGITKAKRDNADFVVFDIDTFGGRVDSALEITTLIKSVEPAATVAYVTSAPASKGVSWSAGAIIALSCRSIYMAPGTSMGAAAPVYQTSEGPKMAPEKVVSPLRTQAKALAEKNGYPVGVALAMVDKDVELLEVHIDGQVRAITAADLTSVEREAEKNKQEVDVIKTISEPGKLLTLTAGEMEKYGVSSGTVPDDEKLFEALGARNPRAVRLKPTPADELVGLLTSTAVITLLTIAGLITLYMEITSPGFGIPGTVAIICFAVVFTSSFLLGRVSSLELLMLVVGVVLLIVEIFLIPGFGATGIAGILLIVASLVLSMQVFAVPEVDWQWDILVNNLIRVGLIVTASLIGIAVLAHLVPRAPVLRRLTLTSSEQVSEGFTAQAPEAAAEMVGKRGMTVTKLRPTGKARFEDRVMNVETQGEFVNEGEPVEILEASGNRIVVRKC